MKNLIDTLKNIWAIDELKSKIIVTLLFVLTYRIGAQITLPGINPLAIEAAQKAGGNNGLLGIFDMFAGGAFSQASILALGIMPYISASIFMQLMTILVPQMAKVQKEGESNIRARWDYALECMSRMGQCVEDTTSRSAFIASPSFIMPPTHPSTYVNFRTYEVEFAEI